METTNSSIENSFNRENKVGLLFYQDRSQRRDNQDYSFYEKNAQELPETFSNYLEIINLSKDSNLIVLSSSKHYYYEAEDLKDVKIVVNLKPLNHINQVREFLNNIFDILPAKCNLIGCFSDNKRQNRFFSDSFTPQRNISDQFDPVENGIMSRIPFLSMIYNFVDVKTNRYLTNRKVTLQLEQAELKVLDMRDLKGLTYFCAQKVSME